MKPNSTSRLEKIPFASFVTSSKLAKTKKVISNSFVSVRVVCHKILNHDKFGREEFSIWEQFIKRKVVSRLGCRAACKKCGKEMQGLVDGLKSHWEICKNKTSGISGLKVIVSLSPELAKIKLSS